MKRTWVIRILVAAFGLVTMYLSLFLVFRSSNRSAVSVGSTETAVSGPTVAPNTATAPRSTRSTRSS